MTEKTLRELITRHKEKKVIANYSTANGPFESTVAALDQLFKKEPFAVRETFFLNLLCNGYTTSPAGGRFELKR